MPELELVVVYTSNGPLGAEVIKGKLESAGIPALLKSEARGTFAFTIDGMGQVQVLVSKSRAAEARAIIEERPGTGDV